jgi:hypothetical protein
MMVMDLLHHLFRHSARVKGNNRNPLSVRRSSC